MGDLDTQIEHAVTVAATRTFKALVDELRERGDGLPLLLTQGDAATQLACSRRHVADLIDRGDLEAVVEGGRRKVVTASLRAFVASLPSTVPPQQLQAA